MSADFCQDCFNPEAFLDLVQGIGPWADPIVVQELDLDEPLGYDEATGPLTFCSCGFIRIPDPTQAESTHPRFLPISLLFEEVRDNAITLNGFLQMGTMDAFSRLETLHLFLKELRDIEYGAFSELVVSLPSYHPDVCCSEIDILVRERSLMAWPIGLPFAPFM